MKVQIKRQCGFTLLEIMIVCAIIGLLAILAIPNWATARTNSQRTNCMNNLRQIDAAKQQWALEMGKGAGDPAPTSAEIQPYLGRGNSGSLANVTCPSSGGGTTDSSYTIGDLNTPPVCKIVGIAQQPDVTRAHVLQ